MPHNPVAKEVSHLIVSWGSIILTLDQRPHALKVQTNIQKLPGLSGLLQDNDKAFFLPKQSSHFAITFWCGNAEKYMLIDYFYTTLHLHKQIEVLNKQILVIYAATTKGFYERTPIERFSQYEKAILGTTDPKLQQPLWEKVGQVKWFQHSTSLWIANQNAIDSIVGKHIIWDVH